MVIFAIASHKRLNQIKKKTLAFLNKHGIPKEDIYLFVSPESYEDYMEEFKSIPYNIIFSKNNKQLKRVFQINQSKNPNFYA